MVIDTESSNLAEGIIRFKPIEKQLPKTWEEFCDTHPIKDDEYYIKQASKIKHYDKCGRGDRYPNSDKNVGTKETCEAVLALMQLIQLRDCYNDGWKPDWGNNWEEKHVIFRDGDYICKDRLTRFQCVLNFKTTELRDQFLENFRDLIEIAKPLI